MPLVFILSLFFIEDKKYAGLSVMLFAANSNILINAVSGYSESLFTLIFLTMGWMTLQLRKQKKTARILLFVFAILWAWLYYIKPEGLLTGGIFFLWIVLADRTQDYLTWIVPIIVLILVFPYMYFLKEHTGRWQLSGKTYANLVMGELNSPYQTGIDNRTKDDRYYINDRTASNPTLSYGFASYWYEKENDILLRIPVNVVKWIKTYWQTFSIIGIVLGVWGIVSLKRQSSYFLITLMAPMAAYMIFFVLPRTIAMYHWIWIVFLMYGLKDLSFFIESKWKISYTDSLIWTAAILIAVYQMRDAIKLII
ncbi:hypothetical protein JNM05_13590 [bacterium]|nr:hypothetical protein [bacterium]